MITLPAPMTLIAKDETGSTNDDAKALAENGADDLTVVWALRQTRGRGRLGRPWHSNSGNLLWSAIVRMEHNRHRLSDVTFATALAVRDAVSAYMPMSAVVELKWPNDVLINGGKVSGTLIETGGDGRWIVVGVGINLAEAPTLDQTLYKATSMLAEGATCTLDALCESLSLNFLSRITAWRDEGVTPEMVENYKSHLWRVGQEVSVSFDTAKTDVITGINRSIDSDFSLRIETKDGIIRNIYAGDVLSPNS